MVVMTGQNVSMLFLWHVDNYVLLKTQLYLERTKATSVNAVIKISIYSVL